MTKYRYGEDVFKGYRIGDDGSVWSKKRGEWKRLKPLTVGKRGYGYQGYAVSHGGKVRIHYAQRLVLTAFVGPCPEGMRACWADGDRSNNALTNLSWGKRERVC